MKLNFLCMQILFLVAITCVKTGFASGYSYYKQVTGNSEDSARVAYKYIKNMSDKASFLDCPIELIERQWRGPESVLKGTDLLQKFIRESTAARPNYEPIIEECQTTLANYRRMDREGIIRARAIVGEEKAELIGQLESQSVSAEDAKLMTIIGNTINQDTLCQTNRLAFHTGYIAGISMGGFDMHCVTPLGRRFKLHGPTLGLGYGIGAVLSLPNKDSLNPTTFGFALYKRSERKLWKMSNLVSTIATGVGLSADQDVARRYRGHDDSALYLYDIRPAIGAGIFINKTINLMRKKDQSPLYIDLAQANLLDNIFQKSRD